MRIICPLNLLLGISKIVVKYNLFIKPSSVREIESVGTKKDRINIINKVQELKENPMPFGCEKLSGQEKYRIRLGNYRIVHSIDDDKKEMVVVKVGHRKEIYR